MNAERRDGHLKVFCRSKTHIDIAADCSYGSWAFALHIRRPVCTQQAAQAQASAGPARAL